MISSRSAAVQSIVALLAEGVDRNFDADKQAFHGWGSPSSRRAWIEIACPLFVGGAVVVALLAEGVDRNTETLPMPTSELESPSSRRAWIEIPSVWTRCGASCGRPPRGGRG